MTHYSKRRHAVAVIHASGKNRNGAAKCHRLVGGGTEDAVEAFLPAARPLFASKS
ncbi:MAG: hypothetical protein GX174_01455 [Lentisphaerae bacterium]|nr:hypothetical protein [Lentisphaerota bacterium]